MRLTDLKEGMTLKLPITEDHIVAGRTHSCEYCPAALALRQLFVDDLDGPVDVWVERTTMYVSRRYPEGLMCVDLRTSMKLRMAIRSFDDVGRMPANVYTAQVLNTGDTIMPHVHDH